MTSSHVSVRKIAKAAPWAMLLLLVLVRRYKVVIFESLRSLPCSALLLGAMLFMFFIHIRHNLHAH